MAATRTDRRGEFESIAMPHVHSLYNFALRFTRKPEEAEDLSQDTLLRAYRFFDKYEPGTNIRAWLFKIMRNLFINKYRKNQREPEALDYGGAESSLEMLVQNEAPSFASGKNPEEVLVAGAVDTEVEGALAELPEEYRMVFLLSTMEELSYKEIALALSIPIGTVMSRLHRARRLMQKTLMDYAVERGLVDLPASDSGEVVNLSSFKGNRRK
jgi:RNA polymerase sigma-70 factor (ECF subfamily)